MSPRSEKIFKDCTDYIFAEYPKRIESLQASIGDGLYLEPFADMVRHGITLFARDRYPVLVIEPTEFGLDLDHGAITGASLPIDVLAQIRGRPDDGDSTTFKMMRYADAFASLLDEDFTLGGLAMNAKLVGRIKFYIGKEGEQMFSMFLAQIEIKY